MQDWNDDEILVRDLREALGARRPTSERAREAARAAFCWRTVDQDLHGLLTLAHDSDLADSALVRAASALQPRLLSFEGSELSLEVEVAGDQVVGQVVGQVLPAGPCPVAVRAADGRRLAAEADESGFFMMVGIPTGSVRFEVGDRTSRRVTTWLLL